MKNLIQTLEVDIRNDDVCSIFTLEESFFINSIVFSIKKNREMYLLDINFIKGT